MKNRQRRVPASDRQFELKYCERCGVLWVRPVGDEKVYCAECSRKVDELPPVSQQSEIGRAPEDLWSDDESEFFEGYEQGVIAPDSPGGAA